MKNILFVLIAVLSTFNLYSQDIIVQKNGDEVKAKVLEVTSTEIKYKKFSNPEGPTYTVTKADVFMIKYQNGDKDVINTTATVTNGSNDLSRNNAEKLIKEYFEYPNVELTRLPIHIYKKEKLQKFMDKGLVSVVGKNDIYGSYEIRLTEKGKVYVVAITYGIIDLEPLMASNVREFDKITGVKLQDGEKEATVNYTIKRTNITPFGEYEGYQNGDIVNYTVEMELFDDGWRIVDKDKTKNYKPSELSIWNGLNTPNTDSKADKNTFESQVSYYGSVSTENESASVSLAFLAISDEVNKEQDIKNAVVTLFKDIGRFQTIDENKSQSIAKQCAIKVGVTTRYQTLTRTDGSTWYHADIDISMELFDKTNKKSITTKPYFHTITTRYSFGGAYVSKEAALDILIKEKLAIPIAQFIYSCFPIKGEVLDVVEVNKKGEAKQVKITCEKDVVVRKDLKFKVVKDNRANEEYDLEVQEVNGDNIICSVKNNRLLMAKGTKIITIYKL